METVYRAVKNGFNYKRFPLFSRSARKEVPNLRRKRYGIILPWSGRSDLKENLLNKKGMKVVVATGEGFDPLHERHIRWF